MKQLADEELVLVSTKPIMNQFAEIIPTQAMGIALDCLKPARRRAIKVHGRQLHPKGLIHAMHIKITLDAGLPQLGVFALKFWEGKLG